MLCPACGWRGIPQAMRIHRLSAPQQVAAIGVHTLFGIAT
jgi:hypothetical protein